MATLSEVMLSEENRPKVLKDCVEILESEVRRKRGVTGMAIKAGFGVLKKVKPNMVEEAMDSLLDEFVHKLEPLHEEYEKSGRKEPLESFLDHHKERIATALLEITDERAQRSRATLIKSTYQKLRPMAAKQIHEALPAVAGLLKKYL